METTTHEELIERRKLYEIFKNVNNNNSKDDPHNPNTAKDLVTRKKVLNFIQTLTVLEPIEPEFRLGFEPEPEPEPEADPEVHVFLLAGQSNMVGRPVFDNGPGYPDGTLQYGKTIGYPNYTNTSTIPAVSPLDHWDEGAGDMGLSLNFAIDYVAANNNAQIVFIPAADGGTGFEGGQWNPGDQQYNHAVNATNALMAENPDWIFKGVLWHQGESDSENPNFEVQFYRMIQSMREDINEANQETPFILGELLVGGRQTTVLNSGVLTDTPTYNYETSLVSAASLTSFDDLHFDASSLRTFGSRYENSYKNLNNPYPTAEVGAAGHWIFGSSNQLFIDLTGSTQNLTIQNDSESEYVYNLGDTIIPGLDVSGSSRITRGLLSDIDETPDMTMCMVIKYTAPGRTILNGNLSFDEDAGHSWFFDVDNNLRFNERNRISVILRNAADFVEGNYYFIASSIDSNDNYILMIADASAPEGCEYLTGTGTGGGRNISSTRKMSVGNAHYLGPPPSAKGDFIGPVQIGEAIFFNSAKTLNELKDIAVHSEARMSSRGITLNPIIEPEPEPDYEPEPQYQPNFRNNEALYFQPNFIYETGATSAGVYIGFITQDYMRIRMGSGNDSEKLFAPFPGFTDSRNTYVTGDGVISGSREYTNLMHLDIHRRSLPISAGSTSNMIVEMNANRKANGLSGSSIRVWVNGLLVGNLNDDVETGSVAGSDEHGYGVVLDSTPAGSGALVDTSSSWYTQMSSSTTTKLTSFIYNNAITDVSIDQDFVDDYNTSNGTNITLENLLYDTSFSDLMQAVEDEGVFRTKTILDFGGGGAFGGTKDKLILFFEDIILLQ